jgi:ketosteroid isomerase-like protein
MGVLSGKLKDKIEEMYAPTAIVFTGSAKRSESAKLVALRRSRRYAGGESTASAEEGPIDVQIVGPDVAIAAYTYSFGSDRTRPDGTKVRVEALCGRATQVFQRDEAGVLRIVHEHLSAGAAPEMRRPPSG